MTSRPGHDHASMRASSGRHGTGQHGGTREPGSSGEHGRAGERGSVIDRVGLYETFASIGFAGQRRRVYRRIVALSGAHPGDKALDVGCSGGFLARLLAEAVAPSGRVAGIDPSERAVAYATRRAPANATFTVAVAQDLGLPDESFDVVTSTLAVHHVPESEREAAFAEMFRVLRPGGRLLVADMRPPGAGSSLLSSAHGVLRRVMRGRGHAARHSAAPLEELAAEAGFEILDRGDVAMLGRYILAIRPLDAA